MAAPRDSLLPGNATARETAHAETDGRLDDIDMDVIRRAKDPATAPAAMLPALAWEWSADVWDPAWPVDIKRRVVAASPEVHRLKGTRRAVQVALNALHIKATIEEWWQKTQQGPPYTFHVRAYAYARFSPGYPILGPALTKQALSAIVAAKPVSRAFTMDIGLGAVGEIAMAAAGRAVAVVARSADARPSLPRSEIGMAAAGRIAASVYRQVEARAPLPRSEIGMAAVCRLAQSVSLKFEVRP